MKNLLIFIVFLASCASPSKKQTDTVFNGLLSDIKSIDFTKLNKKNPILAFNKIATEKANKIIEFDKTNIESALAEASQYKICIITVKNYTLVKIIDFNDKLMSGSWGIKLPKGKGYVLKKGELNEKNDYINNIIGTPKNFKRKMFLFN